MARLQCARLVTILIGAELTIVRPSSLAVIGLGAIGGSLAWQARLAGSPVSSEYSTSRAEGVQALRASAITEMADTPAAAVRGADLVVLAVPAQATLDLIGRLRPALEPGRRPDRRLQRQRPGARPGFEAGLGDRFAGGHPLAGTHGSGFAAARPDRLRGCVVYVCETGPPAATGRPARDAVLAAKSSRPQPVLIDADGARPAARLDQPPAPGRRLRPRQGAGRPRAGRCVLRHRAPGHHAPGREQPRDVARHSPANRAAVDEALEPPASRWPSCGALLAAATPTASSATWRPRSGSAKDSTGDGRRVGPRPGRQEHHPSRAAVRRDGPRDEPRGRRADLARRAQHAPGCCASSARDLPLRPGQRRHRRGRGPPAPARRTLDCGNSGTTTRLLLGLLAGHRFAATLTGDASLRRRPMRRVTGPLARMGARITERGGDGLPLTIRGGELLPLRYELPVSSAQIKSALLLAGIVGGVEVALREPHGRSRDHTERMLREFGYRWPSRTAGFASSQPEHRALRSPGARRLRLRRRSSSAPPCWPRRASSDHRRRRQPDAHRLSSRCSSAWARRSRWRTWPTTSVSRWATWSCGPRRCGRRRSPPREIPGLIDEIPLLAVLASRAEGTTVFREVGELRVKESDRLGLIAENLRAVGVGPRWWATTFTSRAGRRRRGRRPHRRRSPPRDGLRGAWHRAGRENPDRRHGLRGGELPGFPETLRGRPAGP